jgi:hypothetical protein
VTTEVDDKTRAQVHVAGVVEGIFDIRKTAYDVVAASFYGHTVKLADFSCCYYYLALST